MDDDAYAFPGDAGVPAVPTQPDDGPQQPADQGTIVHQYTLWVGNIPTNITVEHLAALMSRGQALGTVQQVEVSSAAQHGCWAKHLQHNSLHRYFNARQKLPTLHSRL
jgi:hypothetical protein